MLWLRGIWCLLFRFCRIFRIFCWSRVCPWVCREISSDILFSIRFSHCCQSRSINQYLFKRGFCAFDFSNSLFMKFKSIYYSTLIRKRNLESGFLIDSIIMFCNNLLNRIWQKFITPCKNKRLFGRNSYFVFQVFFCNYSSESTQRNTSTIFLISEIRNLNKTILCMIKIFSNKEFGLLLSGLGSSCIYTWYILS